MSIYPWPRDLASREQQVTDDELDIPLRAQEQQRIKARLQALVPAIERTFALPGFWQGAIYTRKSLGGNAAAGRGNLLCNQIIAALDEQTPLAEIAAYAEWRAGAAQ